MARVALRRLVEEEEIEQRKAPPNGTRGPRKQYRIRDTANHSTIDPNEYAEVMLGFQEWCDRGGRCFRGEVMRALERHRNSA